MKIAQVQTENPTKICEGLVALRFISASPYTSWTRKRSGYRVKLEDGGHLYVVHEFILLKIFAQLETRYKVLSKNRGYYLENPLDLLEFVIAEEAPIIIKRELREDLGGKARLYWDHRCQ